MLERIPEERAGSYLQALKRYREMVSVSELDENVVHDLKNILSLSVEEDSNALDEVASLLFKGSYGNCKSCGEDISEIRMLAKPLTAKRCLSCQSVVEMPLVVASTTNTRDRRYQDLELNRPRRHNARGDKPEVQIYLEM